MAVWLTLQVQLGLSPWDVLHAGVSTSTGLSFGLVVAAVGLLVLAAGTGLGVRPGWGTVGNVLVIGVLLDVLIAAPALDGLADASVPVRAAVLLAATGLLGLGGALYIGAGFGAGPRDSLMVALARRGVPVGVGRCGVELTVLALGWLLHGPVGVGTAVVALLSGPAVQASFALVRRSGRLSSRLR